MKFKQYLLIVTLVSSFSCTQNTSQEQTSQENEKQVENFVFDNS